MKFITVNNILMIQCGDYNWEVYNDERENEYYTITICRNNQENIQIIFCDNIVTVNTLQLIMDFKETEKLLKSFELHKDNMFLPIYKKDTVKIKKWLHTVKDKMELI